MVELLFQQRRKKISTILKAKRMISPADVPHLPYMDRRVEALTPEQIGELVDAVYEVRRISAPR
jgi:16S rRNA A1518/A1519 N6-dimethyltransferase RsmA/KsgA/DIM1 with predicted DNA glycosylase/AP lyase activity